jgi:protein-S-isoprenylcysteine O-methyltransferase Ste14
MTGRHGYPARRSCFPTHSFEQRLRVWTGISWLLPTAMALQGAWRGRRASGRQVGRAFADLPKWYLFAFVVPYAAVFLRLWRPLPVRLSPTGRLAASISGAALSLVGMGLIMWGRMTLGRMYNVSSALGNRLYDDQELVTSGPFALVRHPMYVGALIAGVGGVLLYRTWAAVLVLTHEAVFWVRAGREDQALEAEFGETWRAYARRVHAGVPVLGGPRIDRRVEAT